MSKIDSLKILLEEAKYNWEEIRKEFSPFINKIVSEVIKSIDSEAKNVKIVFPYKKQYLLEEVIKELKTYI